MIEGCYRTELFGIRTDGVGRVEKVLAVDPPPNPATHQADLIQSRFDAVTDRGAELAKDIDSAVDGAADIHGCLDEVGVHGVIHGSSLHPAADTRSKMTVLRVMHLDLEPAPTSETDTAERRRDRNADPIRLSGREVSPWSRRSH